MTEWFRRKSQNIKTIDKKDTKEGMWIKCPSCGEVVYSNLLVRALNLCPSCSHHFNFSSLQYIDLLLDKEDRTYISDNIFPSDPLEFSAFKKYSEQLTQAQKKTGINDAVIAISGKLIGKEIVIVSLDFDFIGGSMGSVVGEVISQSIEYANKNKLPLLIISSSGGARMQEGAISLMQLAKTSSKMSKFSKKWRIIYITFNKSNYGGCKF